MSDNKEFDEDLEKYHDELKDKISHDNLYFFLNHIEERQNEVKKRTDVMQEVQGK